MGNVRNVMNNNLAHARGMSTVPEEEQYCLGTRQKSYVLLHVISNNPLSYQFYTIALKPTKRYIFNKYRTQQAPWIHFL